MVNEKMLQTIKHVKLKVTMTKWTVKNKHIQNKQLFGVDFDFPLVCLVYIY